MKQSILSLIPGTHGYALGKVYEGVYSNYPLAELNFKEIMSTHTATKEALDKQYGLSSLPGAADVVRRIDYILSRLQSWVDQKALFKNDDAEVFLDAFSGHWEEYILMLKELDEENRPHQSVKVKSN